MSNDPWQILILDANTATEKDVKAAYARMLKQHRPDSDPEGFRRVREAYEIALAAIRARDAEGAPPPGYAQDERKEGGEPEQQPPTPEYTPPVVELPEPVQPSFAEVGRAAASGNAEQLEAAILAFHQQCETSDVDGLARVQAFELACAGNVKLLAAAIPDVVLLRVAELGQVNLPHLVLSAWMEEQRREKIVQFGRMVLDHGRKLATPDGAILMGRIGILVGLERPGLSSALGNLCYPNLPVDSRTQIMGQLEHETALGKVFEDVTPAMKPFWFARLRNADEPHDWSHPDSLRAIDDLVHRSRHQWEGWGIIRQLLPPDRWAQVESRLWNQGQQAAQSAPEGTKFPAWLIIPLILIGVNVLRFIGSESSTSSRGRLPSIEKIDSRLLQWDQLEKEQERKWTRLQEDLNKLSSQRRPGNSGVGDPKAWEQRNQFPTLSPELQPRALPSTPPSPQPARPITLPGVNQPVPDNSGSRDLLQNPMFNQRYWTPPPPPQPSR